MIELHLKYKSLEVSMTPGWLLNYFHSCIGYFSYALTKMDWTYILDFVSQAWPKYNFFPMFILTTNARAFFAARLILSVTWTFWICIRFSSVFTISVYCILLSVIELSMCDLIWQDYSHNMPHLLDCHFKLTICGVKCVSNHVHSDDMKCIFENNEWAWISEI